MLHHRSPSPASGCTRYRVLSCLALFAAMFTTPAAWAVREEAQQGDPGLRDREVPADVPHISGMWQVQGYQRYIKPMDGSDPPWQPWNKQAFEERAAAEAAGTPLYDPTAACLPSGYPRLIAAPYPVEIIQTPDTVVFLYETQHLFRIVYLNQEHPAQLEPTHMGHSVGHYEGDTLVVHSTGFVDYTQIENYRLGTGTGAQAAESGEEGEEPVLHRCLERLVGRRGPALRLDAVQGRSVGWDRDIVERRVDVGEYRGDLQERGRVRRKLIDAQDVPVGGPAAPPPRPNR